MRWKQFFTPVKSANVDEARQLIQQKAAEAITLLDVRQPGEYQAGHIPGAKLIPLAELTDRLEEIDTDKPIIVYCAIGGRSRVAAQMLAGKGFKEVINLSGGIKAWQANTAIGSEDLGLDLFSGTESIEETLVVAYSLEAGLREFYLSMVPKVANKAARGLFEKLSAIEIKHQEHIFNEYLKITGATVSQDEFAAKVVQPAMEGGLSTEDYLRLYQPNLAAPEDVISLAMAIEAQALDLYQRAADRAATDENKWVLLQIANEERAHLQQLGKLFEGL